MACPADHRGDFIFDSTSSDTEGEFSHSDCMQSRSSGNIGAGNTEMNIFIRNLTLYCSFRLKQEKPHANIVQ